MANKIHAPDPDAAIRTARVGSQADSASGSGDDACDGRQPTEPMSVTLELDDGNSVLDMLDLLDMADPEAAATAVFEAEGLLSSPCDSLAGFATTSEARDIRPQRCQLPPAFIASGATEAGSISPCAVTSSGASRPVVNQCGFGSSAAFEGLRLADMNRMQQLPSADVDRPRNVAAADSSEADMTSMLAFSPKARDRHKQAGPSEIAVHRGAAGASRNFTLECTVCGDRARGYNFGAVACESCKAFFRRTVLRNKPMTCLFAGNCVPTVKTRKFCPACRLDKCLAVGMNKRLVRGDEEKKQRKDEAAKHSQDRKKKVPTRASSTVVAQHQRASAAAASDESRDEEENDAGTAAVSSPAAEMPHIGSLLTSGHGSSLILDASLDDGSGSSLSTTRLTSEDSQGAAVVVALLSPSSAPAAVDRCGTSPPPVLQQSHPPSPFMPIGGTIPAVSDLPSAFADEKVGVANCFGTFTSDGGNASDVVPSLSDAPPLRAMHSLVKSALDELRLGRRHAAAGGELPRHLLQPAEDPSQQRRLSSHKWAELIALGRLYSTSSDGQGEISSSTTTDYSPQIRRRRPMSAAVGAAASYDLNLVAHQTSAFIRRMVAFARELPEFFALPLNLQMHMLKASAGSFITVRSAELYLPEAGCFFDEQGCKISADVISCLGVQGPETASWRALQTELIGSIRRLLPTEADGRCDVVIVALLHAVLLMSPEYFAGGSGRKVPDCTAVLASVSDAQQNYIMRLRRYIEAKYSYATAAELVPELIRLLSLCKRTAYMLNALLLDVEPIRHDPLLHEVLEPSPPVR